MRTATRSKAFWKCDILETILAVIGFDLRDLRISESAFLIRLIMYSVCNKRKVKSEHKVLTHGPSPATIAFFS